MGSVALRNVESGKLLSTDQNLHPIFIEQEQTFFTQFKLIKITEEFEKDAEAYCKTTMKKVSLFDLSYVCSAPILSKI